MKRKDLYVEIYNTVLTEVHIADRDTLTEILESLSIYKFTDAFSSLLPSFNFKHQAPSLIYIFYIGPIGTM